MGLTLSPASISVGLSFGMVKHADLGNNVQGTIEAPASSAVERVPGGVAGGQGMGFTPSRAANAASFLIRPG